MGEINSGILGGFSGKIAKVQGYRHMGNNVVRQNKREQEFPGVDRFNSQNEYTQQLAHLLKNYETGIHNCLNQDGIEWLPDWEKILQSNRPELTAFNEKYIVKFQLPSGQPELLSITTSIIQTGNGRIRMQATKQMLMKQTGWLTYRRQMRWNSNGGFGQNVKAIITGDSANLDNVYSSLGTNRYQVCMFLCTNPDFPSRYQATFNIIANMAY